MQIKPYISFNWYTRQLTNHGNCIKFKQIITYLSSNVAIVCKTAQTSCCLYLNAGCDVCLSVCHLIWYDYWRLCLVVFICGLLLSAVLPTICLCYTRNSLPSEWVVIPLMPSFNSFMYSLGSETQKLGYDP